MHIWHKHTAPTYRNQHSSPPKSPQTPCLTDETKSSTSYPPLHDLINPDKNLREKKATIFDDWSRKTIHIDPEPHTQTPDSISQVLMMIHTMAVTECIASYEPNPILFSQPPDVDKSEESLPRGTRRVLAQLRSGKSPILLSYLHNLDPNSYSSPLCPLYKSHTHTTQHLFTCTKMPITNNKGSVDEPGRAGGYEQLWSDAQQAAGGRRRCPGVQSAMRTGRGQELTIIK